MACFLSFASSIRYSQGNHNSIRKSCFDTSDINRFSVCKEVAGMCVENLSCLSGSANTASGLPWRVCLEQF